MVPFTDVVNQIRKGAVSEELNKALLAVNEAVIATGKKGELTLKLEVKPMKGNRAQVTVVASINTKTPKEDLPEGIFFLTNDGDLVRNDPEQKELFAAVPTANTDRPYTPPVRGAG